MAKYLRFMSVYLLALTTVAGILLGYSVLTTLMKRHYIRRFGWQ